MTDPSNSLRARVDEARIALLAKFPAPDERRDELLSVLDDEFSLLYCLPRQMLTPDVFARYIALIELLCLSDPRMRAELTAASEEVTP